MFVLAALLMIPTVKVSDESYISYKRPSVTRSRQDPIYRPVWRRVGSELELRRLLKSRPGVIYAHVDCERVLAEGRLSGCRTSNYGGGDISMFDRVAERAALRIIKRYRVDTARLPFGRTGIDYLSINLRFEQPGTGPEYDWGDCFPFCQREPRIPPPPPPPRDRLKQN